MKNTFGTNITVTLFGESHGEEIGAVLDGMAPGVKVDEAFIRHQLSLRRPSGSISTGRVENDPFRIVSGVRNGRTTGTPIAILILNENTKSSDYQANEFLARPGHADYTAQCKYHGYQDKRGGGHFSGRLTAPIVAAGAIAMKALANKSIHIGTHIKSCGGIADRDFDDLEKDIAFLRQATFAVLDQTQGDKMQNAIDIAKKNLDSIGGVLETVVTGLPAGIGEPWFDSVESILSHAMFSIPAVKGVEFGDGFALAGMTGSVANDPFFIEDKQVKTVTNHNGGINGGITNGMPLLFRCAIKPTPSIYQAQQTVNYEKMENAQIQIQGRHDPAIVHRARVVADSVTALCLCDLLCTRFGCDWLCEAEK